MVRRVSRGVASRGVSESMDEVEAAYRAELAKPAVPPWRGGRYQPVLLGDSWLIGDDGRWVLPEWSVGWEFLRWTGHWLRLNGEPFRPTLEQARVALWWYEVDPETGERPVQKGVVQRLKGWGKDPMAGALALFEMLGTPVPFDLGEGGRVIGAENPDAWVQVTAVSKEQTKNTMRLIPSMAGKELRERYGLTVGREKCHALGDTRLLEALTSSPETIEGGRPTFTIVNEPHLWLPSNRGTEMWSAVRRNMTKVRNSSVLAISNAPRPGQGSVLEGVRRSYERQVSGEATDVGTFYDSLEAPPEAPLSAAVAPDVLRMVRGDSVWVPIPRIVKEILDEESAPSEQLRFWYNMTVSAEDAWLTAEVVDALVDRDLKLLPRERVVAFFDASKSDDASALVVCRLSDGALFLYGLWQRPAKWRPVEDGRQWVVDRDDVDARVRMLFDQQRVVAFWADPSETKDDNHESFFGPKIDEWHRRYRRQLSDMPAGQSNTVRWDMRNPTNQKATVEAAMEFVTEAEAGAFRIGAAPGLVRHLKNARRWPGRYGVGLGKSHRESKDKVDAAVAAVVARSMWRRWQNERPVKRRGLL